MFLIFLECYYFKNIFFINFKITIGYLMKWKMLNEYNWYFVSVWNYVILLIFGSELIRVYNNNLLKFIAYYIYIYIYIY